MTTERKTPYNSTYKKLAVQWLNGAFCFYLSSVVADSFRLRNCQLLVAANRYLSCFCCRHGCVGFIVLSPPKAFVFTREVVT
jgi:hypothetical protein